MGRVARRAHADLERIVLVNGRQAFRQLTMAIKAENLLVTLQQVSEARTVRFMTGKASRIDGRGMCVGVLIDLRDKFFMARLAQVVFRRFQERLEAGSMRIVTTGTLPLDDRIVNGTP